MTDYEKLAGQVSRLASEVYRLQQNQLEMQKELIRLRLQEKLRQWKADDPAMAMLLSDAASIKLSIH